MSFQPIDIAELLEAAAAGIRERYEPSTPAPPEQSVLKVNDAGLEIIKSSEGLRLQAYQDITGHWTIGYGHTGDVSPGDTITQNEAEQFLRDDLQRFEDIVNGAAISPSSNEFSAMVSLCYNIGPGNPNSNPIIPGFLTSTVLRQHNTGDKTAAADAFLLWNKARINGQLTVVKGLTTRRQRERTLYLTSAPTSMSRAVMMAFPIAFIVGLGVAGSVAMMPKAVVESISYETISSQPIPSEIITSQPAPEITFRFDRAPNGSIMVCKRVDPCWR